MAYKEYNPNPQSRKVGDCAVRALCKALNADWDTVFLGIAIEAFGRKNMSSANSVWGAYLHKHGFTRCTLPDNCPDCYTVNDFCRDHPNGVFVVAVDNHVVCVCDGTLYDSWDSSGEIPLYYWMKKEDNNV